MKEMPAMFELIVGKAVRDMGIPVNVKGYFYLIEAVRIAFHDKWAVLNVDANIYQPVAEQFNTTARRVSGAITRAINIGWDRCDLGTVENYFGSNAFDTTQFPSNSEFITVLAESVRMGCEKSAAKPAVSEQLTVKHPETIRELATKALHELKMPIHLKGLQYLVYAITLAAEDINRVNALYKVLYPVVAKHFNTTPARVENAIRYAIDITWDLGDLDAVKRRFGYTVNPCTGRPTNSEFIALIADDIQRYLANKD